MANVKLFGLVLIITTSVLALAAISTQTNRIRIRSFNNESALGTGSYPGNSDSSHANSASRSEGGLPGNDLPQPANTVQFVSIPIVVPLCIAGFLGIMLWLTPLKSKPKKIYGRRSSARRRK